MGLLGVINPSISLFLSFKAALIANGETWRFKYILISSSEMF